MGYPKYSTSGINGRIRFSSGWDEALRQIRHGEKDARTAMAEMKPAVQAYLDEMFDQ